MGVQGATQTPRTSFLPTGTPDELKRLGEDIGDVHSCAVPVSDGHGGSKLKGCPFAGKKGRCFAMFNGRNPRIGDFGPKSVEPGTAGQGPENVPFCLRTTDGDELETFMPCHRFLASVYPRMLAARNPQSPSGEKIRILGRAGEAKIVVTYSLPEDPKLCNKNGNNTMVHDTQVITVPKHIRPHEMDPRWKERLARDKADESEAAAAFTDDETDVSSIDAASDEPEEVIPVSALPGAEPVEAQAVAEEAPIRRRGPKAREE